MDLSPQDIFKGLTNYVVLLFSLSVHESAHAWMALRMGDDTAAREGRITLNPAAHIDPLGTVLIPLIQFFYHAPLLAWAKPVPVFAARFRRLSRGHILVAGAGPASNTVLAVLFTIAFFLFIRLAPTGEYAPLIGQILSAGVVMNVALAVFNLVPLPPLDGSWILSWGLPRSAAAHYDRVAEPYGQYILLALFFTGILARLLAPLNYLALTLLSAMGRLLL